MKFLVAFPGMVYSVYFPSTATNVTMFSLNVLIAFKIDGVVTQFPLASLTVSIQMSTTIFPQRFVDSPQ